MSAIEAYTVEYQYWAEGDEKDKFGAYKGYEFELGSLLPFSLDLKSAGPEFILKNNSSAGATTVWQIPEIHIAVQKYWGTKVFRFDIGFSVHHESLKATTNLLSFESYKVGLPIDLTLFPFSKSFLQLSLGVIPKYGLYTESIVVNKTTKTQVVTADMRIGIHFAIPKLDPSAYEAMRNEYSISNFTFGIMYVSELVPFESVNLKQQAKGSLLGLIKFEI